MKIYHYFDEFSPEIKKISKIVFRNGEICYYYKERLLGEFEDVHTQLVYCYGNVTLNLFYKLNKEQKKKWKNFLRRKE